MDICQLSENVSNYSLLWQLIDGYVSSFGTLVFCEQTLESLIDVDSILTFDRALSSN